MIRSSFDISSNIVLSCLVLSCLVLSCLVIGSLYVVEEVYNVVGFSKIILDVVVFCWDSELDELVFESPALFKKAMYFSLDFHVTPARSRQSAAP